MATETKSAEDARKQLGELWAKVPLKDLPKPEKIITIDSNVSTLKAINTLTAADILAAPVRNVERAASEDGKEPDWTKDYLGIVSALDVVALMLETRKRTAGWGRGFEEVVEQVETFAGTTVKDVVDKLNCTPFIPLSVDSSALELLLLLGKYKVHRVAVVDSRSMVNLVTQSAVVRLIRDHIASNPVFGRHAARTLGELGLTAPKQVFTISSTASAVNAFKLLHSKRVSGIPVVDESGAIVGNISARDIRTMVRKPEFFERIYDSTKEFLEGIHEEWKQDPKRKDLPVTERAPAVCCKPTDTLSSVIDQFVKWGIHRMYIVDEKRRPVSVVSLSDVIATFVGEPPAGEVVGAGDAAKPADATA